MSRVLYVVIQAIEYDDPEKKTKQAQYSDALKFLLQENFSITYVDPWTKEIHRNADNLILLQGDWRVEAQKKFEEAPLELIGILDKKEGVEYTLHRTASSH